MSNANTALRVPADYHALAKKRGFRWLGPEAPNARTKTGWECEKGHWWEAPYGSIQQGSGCPFCAGNAPKTSADYHTLAGARGFCWLGSDVPNVDTKTGWECEESHPWETTYSHIKQGTGCPVCANNIPKTPADYHILAEKRGMRWLGPEVPNVDTKTGWECEKGHYREARYNDIKQGRGCPTCAKKTPSDYRALAEKRSIHWLGPEVSSVVIKTGWKCEKGHSWESTHSNIQQGSGCPVCARRSPTSIELAVAAALDICGIEHQAQFRPDGYGRIYDEFVQPNILIEAHGDYFHSEQYFPGIEKRDIEKKMWAEENGYRLVIIWEREIKEQGAWSLVHERILPLLEGKC